MRRGVIISFICLSQMDSLHTFKAKQFQILFALFRLFIIISPLCFQHGLVLNCYAMVLYFIGFYFGPEFVVFLVIWVSFVTFENSRKSTLDFIFTDVEFTFRHFEIIFNIENWWKRKTELKSMEVGAKWQITCALVISVSNRHCRFIAWVQKRRIGNQTWFRSDPTQN